MLCLLVNGLVPTLKKNICPYSKMFSCIIHLKVDFHKSKVYDICASYYEVNQWVNLLGYEADFISFKYLGVSVDANMNIIKNWKCIIPCFNSKVSIWKVKTLPLTL